jgi:hypothetical protein
MERAGGNSSALRSVDPERAGSVILGSSRRSSTAPVQLDGLRDIHFRPEHVLDVAVVEVECVRGSLNPGPDAHRQCVDEYPIVSWNAALGRRRISYPWCGMGHPLSFFVHCDQHRLPAISGESLQIHPRPSNLRIASNRSALQGISLVVMCLQEFEHGCGVTLRGCCPAAFVSEASQ